MTCDSNRPIGSFQHKLCSRRGNLVRFQLVNNKRVPTGIDGFDAVIEGGLLAGKSYLVTGAPGTGKSIFCMQFVLNGLLAGEKAVYVAVDEKPAEIIDEASSFGWNLQEYIDSRKLLILDASPFFTARAGSGKGSDTGRIVADLERYVTRMEASRVVIDPVVPLMSYRDPSSRLHEDARDLLRSIQEKLQTTNILTSYTSRGTWVSSEQGVEEYLVSGVFTLSITRNETRTVRTLLVRKMRGTAAEPLEHEFNILKEKGIAL
jgi:circadian clock protein KaiC